MTSCMSEQIREWHNDIFQSQVPPQHAEDTDARAQSTGKSFWPTNQSVTQPRFWTLFPPQIVHMGGSLKPNVSSQSLAGRAKVEECSLALSSCCISFWHNLACMHRSTDVILFCKMCFQCLGHNRLFAWHRTILSEHRIASISCFLVTFACTLLICTFFTCFHRWGSILLSEKLSYHPSNKNDHPSQSGFSDPLLLSNPLLQAHSADPFPSKLWPSFDPIRCCLTPT